MNKLHHRSNNHVLGAPPGVPIEDCSALPVTRGQLDGIECVMSFWTPDADELAALNAGRPVAVILQGCTHAPLMVAVGV